MSSSIQSQQYKSYMLSDDWQRMKEVRRKIDGNKCVMCGRSAETCKRMQLQCHHITYDRLGHENPYTDLVTLCGSCHSKLHNLLKRRTA